MKPATTTLLSLAPLVLASFVALGCNSCGNSKDPVAASTPSAEPSSVASAPLRPEANGPEASRAFYPLFAKGGHAGAALMRAEFSSDIRALPETSTHPGKRPWTRNEVLDKLDEEVAELKAEVAAGDMDRLRGELGDVLFVIANLARTLDIEPEDALRATNAKFVRRFGFIESALAERGKTPEMSDLAEMDALWDAAKAAERRG